MGRMYSLISNYQIFSPRLDWKNFNRRSLLGNGEFWLENLEIVLCEQPQIYINLVVNLHYLKVILEIQKILWQKYLPITLRQKLKEVLIPYRTQLFSITGFLVVIIGSKGLVYETFKQHQLQKKIILC